MLFKPIVMRGAYKSFNRDYPANEELSSNLD